MGSPPSRWGVGGSLPNRGWRTGWNDNRTNQKPPPHFDNRANQMPPNDKRANQMPPCLSRMRERACQDFCNQRDDRRSRFATFLKTLAFCNLLSSTVVAQRRSAGDGTAARACLAHGSCDGVAPGAFDRPMVNATFKTVRPTPWAPPPGGGTTISAISRSSASLSVPRISPRARSVQPRCSQNRGLSVGVL